MPTNLLSRPSSCKTSDPDALLFPSPNNPQRPYDTRSAWRAALKRANIKDFRGMI